MRVWGWGRDGEREGCMRTREGKDEGTDVGGKRARGCTRKWQSRGLQGAAEGRVIWMR